MAITSVAQMAAAHKQRLHFARTISQAGNKFWGSSFVDVQAGGSFSGMPFNGTPAPLYTAGSGYTYSKASTGALQFPDAVDTYYLYRARVAGISAPAWMTLADRLWACRGMGFAAGTYTVTTPGSLPSRITDGGVGCEIWIIGSETNNANATQPAGTLTVNYLNTSGASSSTTVTDPATTFNVGSFDEDCAFRMPLAAGDLGVSQITSVVLGSSWTAENFGVAIIKPVCEFGAKASAFPATFNWKETGLPAVPDDACLFFLSIGGAGVRATLDLVDL